MSRCTPANVSRVILKNMWNTTRFSNRKNTIHDAIRDQVQKKTKTNKNNVSATVNIEAESTAIIFLFLI